MNRFKSIVDCRFTRFVMLALICCLISVNIPLTLYGQWTFRAECAAIAGGAVLVCWLLWCIITIMRSRTPEPCTGRVRILLTACTYALALYGIFSVYIPALCRGWMVQVSWMTFAVCLGAAINKRLDRDAREHTEEQTEG